VLKIDDIRNFDTLKQAALLLEGSVSKLQNQVNQLRLELALMQGNAQPLIQQNILEEELAKLKAAHFGPSSEKRPNPDSSANDVDQTSGKKPKTGHGPTPQLNLPIEIKTYELTPENQICDLCGKKVFPKNGMTQKSELITVTGVQFKIEEVMQTVYGCDCNDKLITAPGPDRAVPGGRYSLEFGVFVAEQKFLDHMPLARMQRMMERNGLQISRSTLWDQSFGTAEYLNPSWRALREYVLGADWAHCDETHWPMLDGPGTSKYWAWCVASDDAVFYDIHKSRSAQAAKAMLGGFEGVLITDGYSAYETMIRGELNTITHAHCWAHVRRKFLEAEARDPRQTEKPIAWIARLFEIERQIPKFQRNSSLSEREVVLALRRTAREEQSRPVINELRQWAYEILPTLLPSTGLAMAVNYMLKLWPGLTVFLTDPRVPIDNNHAEREIRGVVVGRKNHYGSKSKRGTVTAAIFYSLFESAKLVGVDPKAYVLEAARRACRKPGTVTLPHDLLG
jgi:transposase